MVQTLIYSPIFTSFRFFLCLQADSETSEQDCMSICVKLLSMGYVKRSWSWADGIIIWDLKLKVDILVSLFGHSLNSDCANYLPHIY